MTEQRLDVHLVEQGLARSRGHARELLSAGAVTVGGRPVTKGATQIRPGDSVAVELTAPPKVGRAAYKLERAFVVFGTEPEEPFTVQGRRCLDVGASTGGFTQVLLEQGAAAVTALDVGHGQLAETLRTDPRVTEISGYNVRTATPEDLGGTFEILVADLSFISLRLVMPALARLLAEGGQAVVLVKPQFEVGRERLGKNGVVRRAADRELSIREVAAAVRAAGLFPRAVEPSGTPGGSGNQEYLMWITTLPALAIADDAAAAARAVGHQERP